MRPGPRRRTGANVLVMDDNMFNHFKIYDKHCPGGDPADNDDWLSDSNAHSNAEWVIEQATRNNMIDVTINAKVWKRLDDKTKTRTLLVDLHTARKTTMLYKSEPCVVMITVPAVGLDHETAEYKNLRPHRVGQEG